MADSWTAPSGPSAGTIVLAEMQAQRTDNIDVLSRAVDGDTSDTTIKHRHKEGTLANLPTAGEAGRQYYATDLGAWFRDTGATSGGLLKGWDLMAVNRRNSVHIFDEFGLEASSTWVETTTGTAAIISTTAANHSVLNMGSGVSDDCILGTPARFYDAGAAASVPALFIVRCIIDTTDVYGIVGLIVSMPSATTRPADGWFFEFNKAVDANWHCVTRSGGATQDDGDSGVAADGSTYQTLVIEIVSATAANFYINGGSAKDAHSGITAPVGDHGISAKVYSTVSNKDFNLDAVEFVAKRAN